MRDWIKLRGGGGGGQFDETNENQLICLLHQFEKSQSDFIKINLNFLCFGCPSGQLALQHVPCDR